MKLVSLIAFLSLFLTCIQSELTILTTFNSIEEHLSKFPNDFASLIITRQEDCLNCENSNAVYKQFAEKNEGVLLTYLLDCASIWANIDDR